MSDESEAVASAYGLRDRNSTTDQLRAEAERLKVCASNEAAAAESLRRECHHLRKDLREIAAGCGVGCPDEAEAKRRIITIRTERDQLKAEVERLKIDASNQAAAAETARRERDAETKRADEAAEWKKTAENQNRLWSRECTRRVEAEAKHEEANEEVARLTKEVDLAQQATLKQVRQLALVETERDQLKAEVERLSKGYHETCFAKLEAEQAHGRKLDHALTALRTGIRASYAQEFEVDDTSPVGDLIRHAFVTLAYRSMKIRKLEAQLKEAKANEAVCHCGALLSEHTQSDNHGAVPMVHPCPNQPPEVPTPAWFHAVANAIDRYGEAGHLGKHVEDGPCRSCTAARAADDLRRLAVKLEGQ